MIKERIVTTWDDAEQSVLRIDFYPFWDWDDYDSAVLETARLLSDHPHAARIPFINVYHHGAKLPMENAVQHVSFMVDVLPNNIIVMICDEEIRAELASFIKLFGYQVGVNYFDATDIEHARAIITNLKNGD